MNMATSTYLGTQLPVQAKASRPAGRSSVVTHAGLFGKTTKKQSDNVKRGLNSEVRKAKKLLPYDQKLMDTWPGRSKKQDAARNTPREGGFGAGGAYQKINKNIPSAAGTKPLANIDPLVYVGGLVAVFLALTLPTILSST